MGFFVALGILYAAFYLAPSAYPLEQAVLIGAAAIFAGGFIGRSGKRGATVGFMLPFLLFLFFGILLFAAAFMAPVAEVAPGLPGVFEGLALGVGQGVVESVGLSLIVAGVIFGLVGAIIGGIGGLISGKLFPLAPLAEEGAYEQPWEYPPGEGGGPW